MESLNSYLKRIHACADPVAWSEPYGDDFLRGWRECKRADWLLWVWAYHRHAEPWVYVSTPWADVRKPIVAAGLDCADMVAHLRPKDFGEQTAAIVAALRGWCDGKVAAALARREASDWLEAALARREATIGDFAASYATLAVLSVVRYARCDGGRRACASYASLIAVDAGNAHAAAHLSFDVRLEMLSSCADAIRVRCPQPPALATVDSLEIAERELEASEDREEVCNGR